MSREDFDSKNRLTIHKSLQRNIDKLKNKDNIFKTDNVKEFLSCVSLENDTSLWDKSLKIIIVEGKKDREFFKKYKNKKNNEYLSLDYLKAESSLDSKNHFLNNNKKQDNGGKGNKELLKSLFIDFNFFDIIKNNNIYGVVDKDYDNPHPIVSDTDPQIIANCKRRLLSDDTHDLEMLVLNSDEKIMLKLNLPNFNLNIFNKALFLSYQLALLKFVLVGKYNLGISHKIDFDRFFKNNKLKVKDYINFALKNAKGNTRKISYEVILKDLKKLNYINKQEEISLTFEDFLKTDKRVYLSLINGHDFLEIIAYLCRINNFLLERKFFEKYDYNNFEKTELYKKMKENNLF